MDARLPSYEDVEKPRLPIGDAEGGAAGASTHGTGSEGEEADFAPEAAHEQSAESGSRYHNEVVRSKLFVTSLDRTSCRRLRGISLANDALSPKRDRALHKRYEFVFPQCYQDVKVFPSLLTTSTKSMPHFYISMLGGINNVAPEPIVVLRAWSLTPGRASWYAEGDGNFHDPDASRLALLYEAKVCALVEQEIGRKAKFVENKQVAINVLAHGRYTGWITCDMIREAGALVTDMEGIQGGAGAEHMLRRLEEYLAFVKSQDQRHSLFERLQRSVALLKEKILWTANQQQSMRRGATPTKADCFVRGCKSH